MTDKIASASDLMTFQDVLKAYEDGYMRGMSGGSGAGRNEGIRAVVEALRDACYGCEHHLLWDEILASDGERSEGSE